MFSLNLPYYRGLQKDCQMLLFSATYDSSVMKFAEAVVPCPVTIRLRREEESLDNIRQVQFYYHQHDGETYLTCSITRWKLFRHVSYR